MSNNVVGSDLGSPTVAAPAQSQQIRLGPHQRPPSVEEGTVKTAADADDRTQMVHITAAQQMLSSGSGAILTSLLMTPLDVVKIRLQSQARPETFTKGNCFLYCNGLMDHLCQCTNGITQSKEWYKRPSHFTGTFDAMVKIARYEGVTSLWSGLPPTFVMAVPATVVYFTCYEQLKGLLGFRDNIKTDQWKPPVAGSAARVWAATLISPIEMVRTKMQSQHLSYQQVYHAVQDMVQQKGILSMWRGLGPTLLRDVPFSAIYWSGYEMMKTSVKNRTGRNKLSFHESFIAGATSGSIAAILTLPFDVIKTRRQIQLGEAESLGKAPQVKSTWKIIRHIYTEEGFRALYTGIFPRLIKVAPSCAIMISTFEFFKSFFLNQKLEEIARSNSKRQPPAGTNLSGYSSGLEVGNSSRLEMANSSLVDQHTHSLVSHAVNSPVNSTIQPQCSNY